MIRLYLTYLNVVCHYITYYVVVNIKITMKLKKIPS